MTGKLSFQKQFPDSKIPDFFRMQKKASKLFPTIRRTAYKPAAAIAFACCRSLRAITRACFVR